jgi:ubiquinone/menaquinone biosynthesis C-methylase UbiE
MMRQYSATEWAVVDKSAEPNAFVDYLDAVQQQAGVQAYKRQTFTMLNMRPGDHVLDVGCGAGDDVRALARLVGLSGRVVGVDSSRTMVEEARRRSDGLPIEFAVGDAHRLDFADHTFASTRADRVFQHLEHPKQALAELVRVTRRGGRVVVADTDWGTLAIDGSDQTTTRMITDEVGAAIRNPWSGRQLFGMFRRAGLEEVQAVPATAVITDYATADSLFHLSEGLRRARNRDLVTHEAASNWSRWQLEADAAGRFCAILTLIMVAGRRP